MVCDDAHFGSHTCTVTQFCFSHEADLLSLSEQLKLLVLLILSVRRVITFSASENCIYPEVFNSDGCSCFLAWRAHVI